jgi:hypothetical protein
MTTAFDVRRLTAALRRSAVRATFAPSVHNTQPWRFELRPNELSVVADPSRQLRVLDPTGRQLMISCGCALFNVRAALAASGVGVEIERRPDPARSDLIARVVASDVRDGTVDPIGALDPVIELRRTNRREFADDDVPSEVIGTLERAAENEGTVLFVVRSEDDRLALARLSQRADAIQNADPAYRAELRAWTTSDGSRPDGVPATAVPHVDGGAHDEIPIRDFDTSGMGVLPVETRSSHNQCLLLLGSDSDDPAAWLRTGEALERILLEITRQGFTASPLTQVIEIPATRAALRQELGLGMYPHILLRVGRAASTPATHRRRLVDVLVERP